MSSPGMLNEERDSLGSHEDQIKNGGVPNRDEGFHCKSCPSLDPR